MTYAVSQTLINVGDSLVMSMSGATSLSAAVTGTNAGATLLIEGSTDGTNWSTLNTITSASTVTVVYGVDTLVRARISVMGSGSFAVTLTQTLAATGVVVLGQVADVAVTPTVALTAYSAGNVVGGKLTFSNVFGPSFSGTLTDILVKSKSVQTTGYTLFLFSQNPTNSTWTDKAAPAINALDLPYLLGAFALGSSNSGLGTETTNQTDAINAAISSVNQNLYGILACVATPTYLSASDVTVSVRVRQN
jgi:hypothetical protein